MTAPTETTAMHGRAADWLIECGFEIAELFGARAGTPFAPECGRAIFWASRR